MIASNHPQVLYDLRQCRPSPSVSDAVDIINRLPPKCRVDLASAYNRDTDGDEWITLYWQHLQLECDLIREDDGTVDRSVFWLYRDPGGRWTRTEYDLNSVEEVVNKIIERFEFID